MEKPIVLRNNAELDIVAGVSLSILYSVKDWISYQDFQDRLINKYETLERDTDNESGGQGVAKMKPALYYGLIDYKREDGKNYLKINDAGIGFYNAYLANDEDIMVDVLLKSLIHISQGRNNQAVPSSCSPIEPIKVYLISSLILGKINKDEYAYIIQCLASDIDYNEIIIDVINKRRNKTELILSDYSKNNYKDDKGLLFLCKCGLTEDYTINSPIKEKYLDKYFELIKSLRIFNTGIDCNMEKTIYNGSIDPVIYYGAPGTGKTRFVQKEIFEKFSETYRIFTTFHQSYCYEEFVEGLKPELNNSDDIKYNIEKGVLYKACEKASILAGYKSLEECIGDNTENRKKLFDSAINSGKIMLLCIDEINRGNIASIFGDLISLIEKSKRLGSGEYEMMVTLPYSKKKFGVPSNLFIVGTMNTADRSIQLLDSALRRRFRFVEIGPSYSNLIFNVNDPVQKDARDILIGLNARIRCLLNKDNQIGHSYLMNVSRYEDIYDIFIKKIIPLLEEYFYNDIDKVRFVLKDNDDKENAFYVEDEEAAKAFKEYAKVSFDEEEKSFYKLREIAPNNYEEFLKHLLSDTQTPNG